MSDVEISRTESLTRQQAAKRLSALAAALDDGGHVELELGASSVKLDVPDHVRCEFEIEVDGDEVELEVELSWSSRAPDPAEEAQPETETKSNETKSKKASAKA